MSDTESLGKLESITAAKEIHRDYMVDKTPDEDVVKGMAKVIQGHYAGLLIDLETDRDAYRHKADRARIGVSVYCELIQELADRTKDRFGDSRSL